MQDKTKQSESVAGAQRNRRIGGGVKLWIHQVLIKPDIKKKIEIHQFLTSLSHPHPLLPFHCGWQWAVKH